MKASRLACAAVATAALVTGAATPAQAAPYQVVDSFEQPVVADNWFQTYSMGQWIGPWQVTKGSVDVVRENYWEAGQGKQSVDLSGGSAGAITRTYPKLFPGRRYKLTFQYAGNPECGKGWRTADVWLDGKKAASLKVNTTWTTKDEMDYDYRQINFKPKWFQSKLTFNSTTAGACGVVIDNVRLTPIFFH